MNNITITTRMNHIRTCTHIDLGSLIDKIRTGSYLVVHDKSNSPVIGPGMTIKDVQALIDNTSSVTDKDKLKASLPVVSINGVFDERTRAGLKEYGCYVIMDYDYKLPSEQAEKNNDWIEFMKSEYVMAMFKSPKGGIKIIVKHSNTNPDLHSELYRQIAGKLCNSKVDLKCSDIARGHFICYDPGIYYNPDASVYNFSPTDSVPPIVKTKGSTPKLAVTPIQQGIIQLTPTQEEDVIKKIQSWSDRCFPICPGHRNSGVFKFAEQLRREGVSQRSALEYLVLRYIDTDFTYTEIECIILSVYG